MVDNTEEYCNCKLEKNEDCWKSGEIRQEKYIEPIANVVGMRKCKGDTQELCKEGNHGLEKKIEKG